MSLIYNIDKPEKGGNTSSTFQNTITNIIHDGGIMLIKYFSQRIYNRVSNFAIGLSAVPVSLNVLR